MRVHFGTMSNRFKASNYQLITSHQKQKFTNFTKFHTVPEQFTQDGALRICKAVTTLTIQVASIIIAISSNKSHGTIITISRKTKCEKHEHKRNQHELRY